MKIKLNNNIYEQIQALNEAQPAPVDSKTSQEYVNGSNNQDLADQLKDDKDLFSDAYKAQCKQMFMYAQRKDSLMIDIKMPSDICKPLRVKKAPEDLANLMRELDVNGKFLNIHNMVEDPQKTFNHATDYALTCFKNLKAMELAKSETDKNTANTLKGEAYNYEGIYGQINEAAEEVAGEAARRSADAVTGLWNRLTDINLINKTGIHLGWVGGKAVGNLANGAVQAGIHFIGGMGVQLALTMGALYTAGYGLGTVFGDANPLKGANNNKELQNSNIETQANTTKEVKDDKGNIIRQTTDTYWEGDNAIEALNEYINNITESVGNLMAQISSKPDKYNEFSKEINKYLNAEDQMLATYFKNHNDIENDAKEQIRKELENRQKLKDMHNENKANFATSLSKLLHTADIEDIRKYYQKIQDHYMLHCSSGVGGNHIQIRNEYEQAVDNGKFSDVIDVYRKYIHENLSTEYAISNALNENESDQKDKKPVADVTGVYNAVRQKVKEFMIDMFPIGDGKNMPGMNDLDAQMNSRIEGATAAVTESIKQVCNVFNNGGTQNGKLGDKLKEFFLSHPLQAARLTELWKAHETELKMRKNRRLKQMQDYGNVERTIGWAADFCKTVVPDLFARLFAYRYLLTILKRDGYYNYTPELYKKDEELWEEQSKEYIKKSTTETEWILSTYGSDYTVGDKPFLAYSDNGVEIQNPMNYASLMMLTNNNTLDLNGMSDDKFEIFVTTAHRLAGNISTDQVMDIIDYMSLYLKMQPLNNDIYDKAMKFRISDEYKNIKPDIQAAYKQLSSFKVQMDNNNMTACWNLLASKPDIFKKYKANYDAVKKIINDHKNTIEKLTDKNNWNDNTNTALQEEGKKLEKQIHDILGDYVYAPANDKPLDFNKMLQPAENGNVDYYMYILSFYKPLLKEYGICETDIDNKAETIREICNDTIKALELINSGILALGHIITENDNDLNILQKGLQLYVSDKQDTKDKTPTLKDIYVYAGGDSDGFDAAYNVIDESLKERPEKDKNGKTKENPNELIYDRIIAQFENPQDAISKSAKVKDNIKQLFAKKSDEKDFELKGFKDLEIPANVKQAKNVTSLKGFAQIEEQCTFNDNIEYGKQTEFLDKLKACIRYIIEYVLASTYSEDATLSAEFNIIVRDLHYALDNIGSDDKNGKVNANFVNNLRDAIVHSASTDNSSQTGDEFDKVIANCKLLENNDQLKKFGEAIKIGLQNPSAIKALPVPIDKLNFGKNIKDCTYTTIYDIAANEKLTNKEGEKEFKYELDETNLKEISDFMRYFKSDVCTIIMSIAQALSATTFNINQLNEKMIFGMTITEYAKYIDNAINMVYDKILPAANDQNNPECNIARQFIKGIENNLKTMNDAYSTIYESTFTGPTAYSKLKNTDTYDITIQAYRQMKIFEGLFNILNVFKDIDLSKINKIEELYNYLSGLEFDKAIFKDLSDDDKKDAILHIIESFKSVSANNEFKKFNAYITNGIKK